LVSVASIWADRWGKILVYLKVGNGIWGDVGNTKGGMRAEE